MVSAPKRPLSGYMLWIASVRSRVSSANPNLSSTELMTKFGAMWRAQSATVRDKFNGKAQKAMDVWKTKFANFKKSAGYKKYRSEVLAGQITKLSKRPRDANRPLRARSAYIQFVNAKRDSVVRANPGLSSVEVIKELSNLWNALSTAGKARYTQMAEKDKARAQREFAKYTKTAAYAEFEKKNQERLANLHKLKDQASGKAEERKQKAKERLAKKKAAEKKKRESAKSRKKAAAQRKLAARKRSADKKKKAAALKKKKAAALKKKKAAAKKKASKKKAASKKKKSASKKRSRKVSKKRSRKVTKK